MSKNPIGKSTRTIACDDYIYPQDIAPLKDEPITENPIRDIINDARCDDHRCSKVSDLNKQAETAINAYILGEVMAIIGAD